MSVGYRLGIGIEGAHQLQVLRGIAIGAAIRAGDREFRHSLRVMDRHVETDDPAVAVADDNATLDLQPTHDLDRVLGHVVVVEWTIDVVGRASVTHLLDCDHLEAVCEERDPPLRDRATPAVEKQERWPIAVDLVVHVQPVDSRVGHDVAQSRSRTCDSHCSAIW